eukprot:6199468-Pleurochrysis_carterae.AAC.2
MHVASRHLAQPEVPWGATHVKNVLIARGQGAHCAAGPQARYADAVRSHTGSASAPNETGRAMIASEGRDTALGRRSERENFARMAKSSRIPSLRMQAFSRFLFICRQWDPKS